MKKKPWLIVVVLVLVVTGISLGLWQFYFRPPGKPDFDKVGGTILVYELDNRKGGKEADVDLTANLAQALERRLDFASVKALDGGRVEIRIPRKSENHEEDVLLAKALVAHAGSLEFRILANNVDDKEAQKDAISFFEKAATDPALQQEFKDAQEKGLPPPGPRRPGTKDQKIYDVNLKNQKSRLTYSWVELGPQERKLLGLDNASEFDPKRNQTWMEAKRTRGKASTLKDPSSTSRLLLQGALFYSRKAEDRNLPEEERRQKAVEYFILTRDPELEKNAPQGDLPQELIEVWRTPKIDGGKLRSAMSGMGNDLRPAVHFTFTEAGGNLFGDLTRKNIPSGAGSEQDQIKRHLAIVLDGQIMSAPTINSEIRTQGQITGSFTKKEVDNLVNILRAGALPASLKPQPVSETEVRAKKGK